MFIDGNDGQATLAAQKILVTLYRFQLAMGIDGLFPLLRKKCPQAFTSVTDLTQFGGKRFAVEVSGLMHAYSHTTESQQECLDLFLQHHARLQQHQIETKYVFDGAVSKAKHKELAKRRAVETNKRQRVAHEAAELQSIINKKSKPNSSTNEPPVANQEVPVLDVEQVQLQLLEAEKLVIEFQPPATTTENDDPASVDQTILQEREQQKQWLQEVEAKKNRVAKSFRALRKVTHSHYTMLESLFVERGIQFCHAATEGEKGCVELVLKGEADIVVSNDGDALTSGAPLLLRNLFHSRYPAEIIDLSVVLSGLNLTFDSFVDFCILCGCDFAKLPGCGAVTALKLMQTHGSIEQWMTSNDPHCQKLIKGFASFDYQRARVEFAIATGTELTVDRVLTSTDGLPGETQASVSSTTDHSAPITLEQ